MSFIPGLTWKDIYLYCSSDSDDPLSEEDEDDDEGHHEDLVESDFRKLEMERGEQKQEELVIPGDLFLTPFYTNHADIKSNSQFLVCDTQ